MLYLLLLAVLLPLLGGVALAFLHPKRIGTVKISIEVMAICTAVLVWTLLFVLPEEELTLVRFSNALSLSLRLDGLGKVFAGMTSFMWPLALLYAFTYLREDPRQGIFYTLYLMTFGVVLGIAFAANALTMYVFYESLTFITLPLITHTGTKEARHAGRNYLYYSLSGSTLALAGIVILTVGAGHNGFIAGGYIGEQDWLTQAAYLMLFFGFGVKTAVFPLYRWLPRAAAAPTPTTALLHAVAVVKSGAFAVMRMTFYCFVPDQLPGTIAQTVSLLTAAFTVVYGSAKAVAEKHFKRRFAYSTVSNLSYILLGVLLCTWEGLDAAILHFIIHSMTKIAIFFACGAIIETAGTQYVFELNGLGKKMPVIFTLFTLAGLSLIGIPLFGGFVSKYYLIRSAFLQGSAASYIGIAALILSAVMTAVYVLSVTVRAFIRTPVAGCEALYEGAKEPVTGFLWVTGLFTVIAVALGIFARPLVELIGTLTGGAV